MRSDTDLVRLHASMRKEAFTGSLAPLLEGLKQHQGPLLGMTMGSALAKPGDAMWSPLLGAVAGSTHGLKGAVIAPAALALYRHLSTPNPEDPNANRYR